MPEPENIEPPVSEIVNTPSPFLENSWKSEPTISKTETEPIIEESPSIEDKKDVENKEGNAVPIIAESKGEEKIIPELPKFSNEESEKVYNLLLAGDTDKVVDIYNEQRKLKESDKLSPEEAIKLSLQYKNKDFSPTDVQDLFEETYIIPEKPIKAEFEDDEDFEIREDKYKVSLEKINRRIERDSKSAITDLQKLSKEIVLPEIQRKELSPVEPTQEELDAQSKGMEVFFEDLNKGAESFKGYNTTFKDEEVEIKVNIPVTQEEKEALSPILKSVYNDMASFFVQLGWADKDGKVSGKLVEDVHLILNKENVLSKMVSEAGNKRYAEAKKSIKNIDYSGKEKGDGNLGPTPQEKGKAMVSHFFSS